MTAEVEVPETAEGVIVAQGASIGGWSLYANDGKSAYRYNLRYATFAAESADPVGRRPPGAHGILAYAGGGLGKAARRGV